MIYRIYSHIDLQELALSQKNNTVGGGNPKPPQMVETLPIMI